MGLSRLDNFLKSSRGTILYVNPNDLDATDSIENQGNSLTRPFKTIQRALIESARFSYQTGLDNDRIDKTTILLYPGDHLVDNRPGYIPDGTNNYLLRSGSTSNSLPPFDVSSNFDLTSSSNELFKYNSVHGGVIVPRGTSIVGFDLRKTKIRPKYVPNPTNSNIESSCIFRVTGGCYLSQFTLFDGDPNGTVYIDYTDTSWIPNFSHHKLRCFEYVDGSNNVDIRDTFLTHIAERTDLEMYYEKVSLAYGSSSGRAISPEYPSSSLDIQPKVDEYRIVGSKGESYSITTMISGDGSIPTTEITVTTSSEVPGLDIDTPITIKDVATSGYNGEYVVSEKVNSTTIKYKVQTAPISATPSISGSTISISSNTTTSSSPYISNCSLRSVYGMCGLLADGNKSKGFKSMIVSEFTGIGLQKDDNAFVVYNTSGTYDDNTVSGNKNISSNPKAIYKKDYRNYHIHAQNNALIQADSVYAIGYAEHFVSTGGGDISLSNSTSNFGATALSSSGFREEALSLDDAGYITHIIPPKEIPLTETAIEFASIDVVKTDVVAGVGSTGNLYLLNEKNLKTPPENIIDGYRIGAKDEDKLGVLIASAGVSTAYYSNISMDGPQRHINNPVSKKSYSVKRLSNANIIVSNVITLTETHDLFNGETVRVISDNGHLPVGLKANTVYYAITTSSGISADTEIKLAKTLNDAINDNGITLTNGGGYLTVESRVSDKNSGDLGHPIQWDSNNSQWFIGVSTTSSENDIYNRIVSLGTTALGNATSRTFLKRRSDSRNQDDTLYRLRYFIPSSSTARPPTEGFILQDSNTNTGANDTEIQTYFGSGSLTNTLQQRNFRFISSCTWSSSVATVFTELPHDLRVGSEVQLVNIKSSGNTTGIGNTGYNFRYSVASTPDSKRFTVGLTTNPGTFTNDTTQRTTSLPYFKKKKSNNTYYIHKVDERCKYISGEQDGVYYLTVANASNSPSVSPFTGDSYSQPLRELYPQTQRDNPTADPTASVSFAESGLIGSVVVDNTQNSVTKETVDKYTLDGALGKEVSDISSSSSTAHTIHTKTDHGLNRVVELSIVSGGDGYGVSGSTNNLYNAILVGVTSSVGKNATAKITSDTSGVITGVVVMDGGSGYGVGHTMAVSTSGLTTFAPYDEAVVRVEKIYDNTGDVVRISGVSTSTSGYNDLYRITNVGAGEATTFDVVSSSDITPHVVSMGTLADNASVYNAGKSVTVSSLVYDYASGIATVSTGSTHGLSVDNKFRVTGSNQSQYNGSFVVTENVNLTSFKAQLGIGTIAPTASGTMYVYPEGISSNEGVITRSNESISGRMVPLYDGITSNLSVTLDNSSENINVADVAKSDIKAGDYLLIEDEIVRVKASSSTNPIVAFRGVLGTKKISHEFGAVVRRIKVSPVELRRHSVIKASGHKFEYVGYGPGNYSTALPDNQIISIDERKESLSQSVKRDGGNIFYSGMNDKGNSYSGNSDVTNTPIRTITGEDIGPLSGLDVISPTEGSFKRTIRVEGGDDGKASSEFNGPVIVNKKLTVNSDFESNSLLLQGDATVSRKYTVATSIPTIAGNPGDVVFNANPTSGGTVGWVYTTSNVWKTFGAISS